MLINKLIGNFFRKTFPESEAEEIRHLITIGNLKKSESVIYRALTRYPEDNLLMCLNAEVQFRQGKSDDAEIVYRRVLSKDPGFAEAHHGLSLLHAEQSRFADAIEHATFALNKDKSKPHFRAHLGYCHLLMGTYGVAEDHLRKAIAQNPADAGAWNNLGVIAIGKKDIQNALGCFKQALQINPRHAIAKKNFLDLSTEINFIDPGNSLSIRLDIIEQNNIEKYSLIFSNSNLIIRIKDLFSASLIDNALALTDQLHEICSQPYDFVSCAKLYRTLGEADTAIEVLEQALTSTPNSADLALALCLEYANNENMQIALKYAELAVSLNNRVDASYLFYLGHTRHMASRYKDAAETLLESLEVCESEILRPKIFKQLIASLIMACRYSEALEYCKKAEVLGLLGADDIKLNSAYAYSFLGDFDTSGKLLDELSIKGVKDPNLSVIRSIIHLLHEEWEPGWHHYQWRAFGDIKNLRTLPIPKWQGEPLLDKSIVILAEQGLGDQIMFASCLSDLLNTNPKQVILEVHERLAKLFELNFPTCKIIATRQKTDLYWMRDFYGADFFVPLADLPRYFRNNRADFPACKFINPDPVMRQKWLQKLESTCARPWIGFSYKGGTESTRQSLRSVPIEQMIEAIPGENASLICLQYGDIKDDIATLPPSAHKVHYWAEGISDLSSFAALVSCLDGVVTVCNTTVHFAGALDVQTFVLAPHVPEWRYGLNFRKMPWYGSVTVLRQPEHGGWAELIQTTRTELSSLLDRESKNLIH
jgi:tetratricopeptide (TPR) repeat protein